MKNNLQQIIYIALVLLIGHFTSAQSEIHFIPEIGEHIDTTKLWYGVLSNLKVVRARPHVKYVTSGPGEEIDFKGNVIVEDQFPILIFTTTDAMRQIDQFNIVDTLSSLSFDRILILEPNISITSRTVSIDGTETYSLFVMDELRNLEIEIFRNCSVIPETENYFGCGRPPLCIEFIGDIVNDSTPEVLLGADREAGVLSILIGKKDNEYQVIKWTEYSN